LLSTQTHNDSSSPSTAKPPTLTRTDSSHFPFHRKPISLASARVGLGSPQLELQFRGDWKGSTPGGGRGKSLENESVTTDSELPSLPPSTNKSGTYENGEDLRAVRGVVTSVIPTADVSRISSRCRSDGPLLSNLVHHKDVQDLQSKPYRNYLLAEPTMPINLLLPHPTCQARPLLPLVTFCQKQHMGGDILVYRTKRHQMRSNPARNTAKQVIFRQVHRPDISPLRC
jgi:hypothetical protein